MANRDSENQFKTLLSAIKIGIFGDHKWSMPSKDMPRTRKMNSF